MLQFAHMRYFYLALGLTLVAIIAYQAIRIMRLASTGRDLAERAVAYEQHPANPTDCVLVIGDSSAVGVGSTNPSESVAGRLGTRYPNIDITNRGRNGLRVKDLAESFSPSSDEHYQLILVQIGGNDVRRFTSLDELEKNLRVVLGRAAKVADHVALISSGNFVAAPIFPWPVDYVYGHRSRLVRDVIARVTPEYKVAYVDLYRSNRETLVRENLAADYAADGFHLSSIGYEFWFNELQKTLDRNGISLD